jgi:hypothetical protein
MTDRPVRVQLRRAKASRMPANTVSVARRPGPSFGNPYTVADARRAGFKGDDRALRETVVSLFTNAMAKGLPVVAYHRENLERLRGKNLACFCPLDHFCHADVLLALANRESDPC